MGGPRFVFGREQMIDSTLDTPCQRMAWFVLLLLLSLSCSAAVRPNVVLVFTDDQGWADIGVHEVRDDIRTPNIDALARSGIRFESGYVTSPVCIPSRAGILSGIYPQRFSVESHLDAPMPTAVKTLAERLRDAGYRTGMVGKWHLEPNVESEGWLRNAVYIGRALPPLAKRRIPTDLAQPFMPRNQGFDDYFAGYFGQYDTNYQLDGATRAEDDGPLRAEGDRVDVQTAAAMAFIERRAAAFQSGERAPFFLYLAYFAPHVPLAASPDYLARFPRERTDSGAKDVAERRRYALAMMAAIDDGVGRLRGRLADLGWLNDTLFFFISDNGAPLALDKADRRPIDAIGWNGSLNDPFKGEKGMLTEGGIRVPFLLSWPNRVAAGVVNAAPVSTLDVVPTVLAAAGLARDEQLDGEDLLTLEQKDATQRPIFWRFRHQGAIRLGNWKYLRAADREYLFDLASDPGEKCNRSAENAHLMEGLRRRWEAWNGTLARPTDGDGSKMGPLEQAMFDKYLPRSAELSCPHVKD